MQFFLAAYIYPQKLMGYTTEISKIASNLSLIKPLADNVKEKAATGQHTPFTQMTVSGRWVVVYTANGINDEDTVTTVLIVFGNQLIALKPDKRGI